MNEELFKVQAAYKDKLGYRYNAPAMYVWAKNEDEAKKATSLNNFWCWVVSAYKIKRKPNKHKYYDN